MKSMTLERWAAIISIFGSIAAVIALWPLFYDSKPTVKGISILQAAAIADQGQFLDRTVFFNECNGTPGCTIACDHALFGDFGHGSNKRCPVIYTCNGDSSDIRHTTGIEPGNTVLHCEPPSIFWRVFIIALMSIVALFSAIVYARRKLVCKVADNRPA